MTIGRPRPKASPRQPLSRRGIGSGASAHDEWREQRALLALRDRAPQPQNATLPVIDDLAVVQAEISSISREWRTVENHGNNEPADEARSRELLSMSF